MYDAIIIGARVAGSPLGMLLAGQGYRVLVVDRDRFPSDTLSTTYLQPEASELLDRWGLLQEVYDSGVPQVALISNFGDGMFVAPTPEERYPAIAPRRTYLDKILVDAARKAGAEVREGFSVQEILADGSGAVTGIRGRSAAGETVREQARIVVGADGRNSFLARHVPVVEYEVVDPATCGYYSFFSGDRGTAAEFHYNGNHAFFAFPTNDGLTCFAGEAPIGAWKEFRSDPEAYLFGKMREHASMLYARAKGVKREESWYGIQGRRAYLRKPYGEGWALLGDAACLKDPVLGTGCNDAFRDAALLSDGLHAWISGRATYEEAMAAYHEARDAAVMENYQRTAFMSRLHSVTPEFLAQLGEGMGTPA